MEKLIDYATIVVAILMAIGTVLLIVDSSYATIVMAATVLVGTAVAGMFAILTLVK